jgi:orotidine-5'-phosphate decarboxylase
MNSRLSQKDIPRNQRLILALDVPDRASAEALVGQLGETVQFYKVGLELFMAGGYFELIQWLRGEGKRVFCDLKFFDVPETVARAVRQLRNRGVDFATVHGNDLADDQKRVVDVAEAFRNGADYIVVGRPIRDAADPRAAAAAIQATIAQLFPAG